MLTMDTYYYGHQSFAISRLIYVIFVRFLAAKRFHLLYYMYVMCFFIISPYWLNNNGLHLQLLDFFNGHSHHTKYDEQTSNKIHFS